MSNLWDEFRSTMAESSRKTREFQNDMYSRRFGDTAGPAIARFMQLPSSMVSGAARTVTDIPQGVQGLYSLGAGIPNGGDEESRYFDRVHRAYVGGKAFEDIEAFENKALEDFRTQNPNATEEEANEWFNRFRLSDGYADFERNAMSQDGTWRSIVAGSENIGDTIDALANAPPDRNKSALEMGVAAGAQAFVPVAGLLNERIANPVARTAVELLVPGSGLRNPRITMMEAGLGAGIAGGATATFDAISGLDRSEQFGEQIEEPDFPDPDDEVASLPFTLPPFFTSPEFAGIIATVTAALSGTSIRAPNAPGPKPFVEGGPGGPVTPPESGRTNSVAAAGFGENAPLRADSEAITGDANRAVDNVVDISINARSASAQQVDLARSRGILPDGTETVPLDIIEAQMTELKRMGQYDLFSAGMQAKSQLDTRQRALNGYYQQLADIQKQQADTAQALQKANTDLANAQSASERNRVRDRIAKLSNKSNELTVRYNSVAQSDDFLKRQVDDPSVRPGLVNQSIPDLQTVIRQFDAVPAFKQIESNFRKFYDDLLKQQPWLAIDEMAEIKRVNPNYMPLRHAVHSSENGELKGLKRVANVVWKHKLRWDDDLFGNMQGDVSGLGGSAARRLDNAETSKVNLPGKPLEAVSLDTRNIIRQIATNNLRMDSIAKMDADARLVGKQPMYRVLKNAQGNIWWTKKQANALIGGVKSKNGKTIKIDPDDYITVWKDGKVAFYKMDNPDTHARLKDVPHQSVPIFRELASIWKTGTTGWLQAAFAPVSAVYDTATANITRRPNTVLGFDYAVDQALRRMGIRDPDSSIRTRTRQGTRTIATAIDPVTYALQLDAATRIMTRQLQEHWTRQITTDLATNNGVFGAIAKRPEGKQFLEKLAQTSLNSMRQSLWYEMVNARALNADSIQPLIKRVDDYERLIDFQLPKGVEYLMSPVTEVLRGLKFYSGALKQSAQYSYALRNRALLLERTGGRTDTKQYTDGMKQIMKDARTLTGNFNERPGSRTLQKLSSTAPYTNVQIVSMRHLFHSIRRNPGTFVTMVGGLAMAKAYGEYMMANWSPESYDRYYRQTPLWQRTARVVLPTPATLVKWAMGEEVPFSEDAIFEIDIANEFRPLIEPMVQGVRALGMATGTLGMGQSEKLAENHGYSGPVGQAIAQSLIPMIPIGVSAGVSFASRGGVRVDPAAPFTGGEMVDASGNPFKKHPIHKESDITQGTMSMIGSIFGSVGRSVTHAWDSATLVTEDDGLMEGILAGVDEYTGRSLMPNRDNPVGGALGMQATERVYSRTPVSEQVSAMREALKIASGPQAVKDTGDPVLDQGLQQLATYARRDMRLRQFSRRYKELDDGLANVEANRQLSYQERLDMKNDLLRQLVEFNKQQSAYLQQLEQSMSNMRIAGGVTYGQAFEQRYEQPFSLRNIVEQAKQYVGRQ